MEPEKDNQQARWRGLLREQTESGQSIAGFCRERALPGERSLNRILSCVTLGGMLLVWAS
jgi:hypothetical protein